MNAKGFTLIELLSVITILSIILLVAMPLVLTSVDSAKKHALRDNGLAIIRAIDIANITDNIESTNQDVTFTYRNGVEKTSVVGKSIKLSGEYPKRGTVMVRSSGEVGMAIHDGKYCAEKGFLDGQITVSEKDKYDCYVPGEPIPVIGILTEEAFNEKVVTENYIPVASIEELANVGTTTPTVFGEDTDWEDTYTGGLTSKYILASDINLDIAPYNTGLGWTPIGNAATPFRGEFDGNNFTISNLYINNVAGNRVGYFGDTTATSIIRNVKFTNVNISGQGYIGVVAGVNRGIMENIDVSGNILTRDYWGTYVGSMAGYNTGRISSCYFSGNITGNGDVGGITGTSVGATAIVENSHTAGTVSGYDAVGGIVGDLRESSVVRYSYADMTVDSDRNTDHPIAYQIAYDGIIINSYATSGINNNAMKKQANYVGWDFTNIWSINEDISYPTLR